MNFYPPFSILLFVIFCSTRVIPVETSRVILPETTSEMNSSISLQCSLLNFDIRNRSVGLGCSKYGQHNSFLPILLFLSGQIELNPGPQYPCGLCEKEVLENQDAICCDHCDIWYHQNCGFVSDLMFDILSNTSITWCCCKCGLPNFTSSTLFNSHHDVSTYNSFESLSSAPLDISSNQPSEPIVPIATSSPKKTYKTPF